MPSYSHTQWNKNGFNHYKIHNKKKSCFIKQEHKWRVHNCIKIENLLKSWDKFKLLSTEEQERMAKVLLVMIELFDYARTDFIQVVIMEYEWPLASYWLFICKDCGFPKEFCSSL